MRCSMIERTDEMLCEVCEERPATRIMPRGPVFPGHDPGYLNVCDKCDPYSKVPALGRNG